jgi:hypothetical protein
MKDEKHLGADAAEVVSAGSSAPDAAPHAAPTHTPGPWSASDTMDQGCMSYCHPEGCLENHPSGVFQIDGPLWDENYLQAGVAAVRNKCDAHLIAAAPEMYEALKAATGYLLNAKIDLETGTTKATAIRTIEGGLAVVRAALAKAEGK